ncbi:MAG: response regulator [Chitinispirillaceae bacterium]|nr:response regulator [Chitinispirillaceae bacterium]
MRIRIHFRIALHLLIFISLWLSFFLFLADRMDALFLAGAISLLVLLGFLIPFLYYSLERPLLLIQRALKNEDAAPLRRLRRPKSRFGPLAELVARSFDQKAHLNKEIGERKKTEEQLAEREKQYRDLFETAPDAIICTDANGTIILNNSQALTLVGYEAAATIVGKNLHDFLADQTDSILRTIFSAPKRERAIRDFECILKKNNGDRFTAEIRMAPILTSEKRPLMLFYLRDITSQKTAERDKKRLEEQFRVVYKMEAIGQLAGGIAHDYNNILGAISGYADLIRNRYTEDDRLKKYANMILSAAKRASELTKKLLIFARKNKLNMVEFDAHEALVEIIDLLNHTLDKTITIIYTNGAVPSFIYGDVIQFQNAIMNLALNSRDAMPDGGTLTFRSATVDVDRSFAHRKDFTVAPGKYLTVTVADTGCGMDQETLAHLFEPFFTTKDIGQGTGLGLASVYGTMKSHNGFIDVQSTVNKGTVITLYFPLVEQTAPASVHQPLLHYSGKGHILLVDDEGFLCDAVREMLTWLGHSVTTSSNGEEALSLFSTEPDGFDLIILDMKMPGMSGFECFRQMKRIKPDVKALISTGYSIEEEQQAMVKEGIIGIIKKPYVSAQLAQAVNSALQGETSRGHLPPFLS